MTPINEIEAMGNLENILSQLQDAPTRDRVLKWAWDKFSTKPAELPEMASLGDKGSMNRKALKKGNKRKTQEKASSKPTIIKDLNLNPKNKKSFRDFSLQKQPNTHQEKCAIAVYYLTHELALASVSINHVYTCYRNAGWRTPASLYNMLAKTAHNGLLDTSNMEAISITTHGENLVEHDLPKKDKSKG